METPVTQPSILLKWAALLLTLLVSFAALTKTIHFLLKYFKSIQTRPSSFPLLSQLPKNNNFEEDSVSDSDSDSDSDEPTSSDVGEDQDFVVKGSSKDRWQFSNFSFRRRRNGSLLDLASLFTSPVVKLFDDSNNSNNNNINYRNSFASLFSSNVVVTLERNLSGRLLKLWDSRVGSVPLGRRFGEDDVVEVNGTGGVLVMDDVTGGLTVGDVRKIGSPLFEADADTWWDADAVISGSEYSVES